MANDSGYKFAQPRTILLLEIERYCRQPDCLQLNRIGLTKPEAHNYTGFDCLRCENWNEDVLTEKDAPEWWEELAITGMISLRQTDKSADAVNSSVQRLSANYRRLKNSDSNGENI